jgi:hypothetical protein
MLATGCLLLVMISGVRAEMTVKEYRTGIASEKSSVVTLTKLYVQATGEGITWANVASRSAGAPIFCQPQQLAIVSELYLDILDCQITSLSEQKNVEGEMVGLLLLKGLKETFPCKK